MCAISKPARHQQAGLPLATWPACAPLRCSWCDKFGAVLHCSRAVAHQEVIGTTPERAVYAINNSRSLRPPRSKR